MPERHPVTPRRLRTVKSSFAFLTALVVAVVAAACTEKIDGGGACPDLCPTQPNQFRDTVIYATELDTTLSGFPVLGLSQSILLANRKDTVETAAVIRFDVLPTAFTPNNQGDTVTIGAVDSVFLRLVIDTSGARGATQVELQAYDVDTTETSPSDATVRSLFRADRLLGTLPITTVGARDTVRIPINKDVMTKKLADKARLRIGIRIAGVSSAQIRILQTYLGTASPLLAFDPVTDTTYLPVGVSASTTFGGVTSEELVGAAVKSLLIKGTPESGVGTLAVGGLPARRSYMRFKIPSAIIDSSIILRAELQLTQQRSSFIDVNDTIAVVPLIGVSTNLVTDIRRAMELATSGSFLFPALDSLLVVPGDSGVKTLGLLGVFRNWAAIPSEVYRSLILRSSHEGSEPAEARFYSIEAPLTLRPRIRITYLPRVERALP